MISTVLGGISPAELGKTLMHEHVLFGYPGYQGDITCSPNFDREKMIAKTSASLKQLREQYSLGALVDATPNDCGRDVKLLREVSEKSGVHIICSTGYYYEGDGATAYYKVRAALSCDVESEIAEMMKSEITSGVGDTGIKPGVIKVASSKSMITPYEQSFFKAAGRVSAETNVPIITHTQEGSMGEEQAQLLIENGADPKKIMIGHIEGNTDLQYYLNILSKGVSIGFDRISLEGFAGTPKDQLRLALIGSLVNLGYVNQIMLSHDFVFNWYGKSLPLPQKWGWHQIFSEFCPQLSAFGVTNEDIITMMLENPKKILDAS